MSKRRISQIRYYTRKMLYSLLNGTATLMGIAALIGILIFGLCTMTLPSK